VEEWTPLPLAPRGHHVAGSAAPLRRRVLRPPTDRASQEHGAASGHRYTGTQ